MTRDRIYTDVEWLDMTFTLIDTGGIEPESNDIILSRMREQAQISSPTRRLIREDFPTLGFPTIATLGLSSWAGGRGFQGCGHAAALQEAGSAGGE